MKTKQPINTFAMAYHGLRIISQSSFWASGARGSYTGLKESLDTIEINVRNIDTNLMGKYTPVMTVQSNVIGSNPSPEKPPNIWFTTGF
jgi:hypothetical protein